MDVLHVDMQDVPHQVCHFLMPLLNQVNNTMSPQNEYASTTWKYMHMMYSAEEGSKLCKKCWNNVVCWCFLRYFGALTATLFFWPQGLRRSRSTVHSMTSYVESFRSCSLVQHHVEQLGSQEGWRIFLKIFKDSRLSKECFGIVWPWLMVVKFPQFWLWLQAAVVQKSGSIAVFWSWWVRRLWSRWPCSYTDVSILVGLKMQSTL